MFRYCKKYQELADKIVREKFGYAAVYHGKYKDYGVFSRIFSDSRVRYVGISLMLMDEKGAVSYITAWEDIKKINKKIRNKQSEIRAQKLYNMFMRKYDAGKYKLKEKKYLEYLKFLDMNNWDENVFTNLRKEIVLCWLEATYRFNDEIAIFKRVRHYSNCTNVMYFVGERIQTTNYVEIDNNIHDIVSIVTPEFIKRRRRYIKNKLIKKGGNYENQI